MRIENGNLTGVGGTGSFGSVNGIGPDSRGASVDGDAGSTDRVELSSASSLIDLAKNVNSADRQSRIANLANQIHSGSYAFNSQDVTKAILEQSA